MENFSSKLNREDRFVLSDMLQRIVELTERGSMVEEELSKSVESNANVKLFMTIPGINVYSAAAIISEIDDVSRFPSKEKLASYAGLVP